MDENSARTILLDIEGTTTSVDFVYLTLFPYARDHLREFVEENFAKVDLAADVAQLRDEHDADARQSPDCPPWRNESKLSAIASVVSYTTWLMDRDRKSRGLKSLQGRIWEEGYRVGDLHSHVYPDVLPAFRRWKRGGKEICIYSSGSVLAQKLLFAHTSEGDLTSYIRAYFDTATGAKIARESYEKIAQALAIDPRSILFLSDTVAELNAAGMTGMLTGLCLRERRPAPAPAGHAVIRSFDEVFPD